MMQQEKVRCLILKQVIDWSAFVLYDTTGESCLLEMLSDDLMQRECLLLWISIAWFLRRFLTPTLRRCIIVVRGTLINLGFYAHAAMAIGGTKKQIPSRTVLTWKHIAADFLRHSAFSICIQQAAGTFRFETHSQPLTVMNGPCIASMTLEDDCDCPSKRTTECKILSDNSSCWQVRFLRDVLACAQLSLQCSDSLLPSWRMFQMCVSRYLCHVPGLPWYCPSCDLYDLLPECVFLQCTTLVVVWLIWHWCLLQVLLQRQLAGDFFSLYALICPAMTCRCIILHSIPWYFQLCSATTYKLFAHFLSWYLLCFTTKIMIKCFRKGTLLTQKFLLQVFCSRSLYAWKVHTISQSILWYSGDRSRGTSFLRSKPSRSV